MSKLRIHLPSLLSQRDDLIAQIPPWPTILRGSLMRYFIECRSRGCKCHRGKTFRHGPYWYLVVHRPKGKQKLYLVPDHKVAQIRQGKKAYERLWSNLLKISELNLLILKGQAQREAR